ncbi:hypothetical protein NA76_16690 [Vibrio vulnificus]|nr:hypothetical protein NA76_16690 [Vibrio vulnificus]
MQKLAASSVSAIHSAISRRIHRLGDSKQRLEAIGQELISLGEDLEAPELDDRYVELEAEYVSTSVKVSLMENELPMLEELQELSAKVQSETKISTLIELLDDEFKDRTVVFFTEYKSTQALIINTLNSKFGFGCSSFINGDGRLDNVLNERGDTYTWSLDRYDAASQFKDGKVRFIVCTEAGGEGIDLQSMLNLVGFLTVIPKWVN